MSSKHASQPGSQPARECTRESKRLSSDGRRCTFTWPLNHSLSRRREWLSTSTLLLNLLPKTVRNLSGSVAWPVQRRLSKRLTFENKASASGPRGRRKWACLDAGQVNSTRKLVRCGTDCPYNHQPRRAISKKKGRFCLVFRRAVPRGYRVSQPTSEPLPPAYDTRRFQKSISSWLPGFLCCSVLTSKNLNLELSLMHARGQDILSE